MGSNMTYIVVKIFFFILVPLNIIVYNFMMFKFIALSKTYDVGHHPKYIGFSHFTLKFLSQ